uniref:Uncharacterized protein n=1 Tax=mine drainage metagenome TaxID=410659 RepID=E6QX97_9ZZZZ
MTSTASGNRIISGFAQSLKCFSIFCCFFATQLNEGFLSERRGKRQQDSVEAYMARAIPAEQPNKVPKKTAPRVG